MPRRQSYSWYKFGADFLHPEFKKFVYAYVEPERAAPPVLATTMLEGAR